MNIQPGKDGTLKDLPTRAKLENVLLNMARPIVNPLTFSACVQWFVNTYRANKAGSLQWPVTFDVFNLLVGESFVVIVDRLHQYGISTQTLTAQFELWPDNKGVGLRFTFWVPASQAMMADDILRQYAGAYTVDHARMGMGYTYGQPWGVTAKPRSWDQVISRALFAIVVGRNTVKVGKADKDQAVKPTKADQSRSTGGDKPAKRTAKRAPKRAKKSAWKRAIKVVWDA